MLNSGVSIFTLNPLPNVPARSPLATATGATRATGARVRGAGAGATTVLDEDEEMALWTALLIWDWRAEMI